MVLGFFIFINKFGYGFKLYFCPSLSLRLYRTPRCKGRSRQLITTGICFIIKTFLKRPQEVLILVEARSRLLSIATLPKISHSYQQSLVGDYFRMNQFLNYYYSTNCYFYKRSILQIYLPSFSRDLFRLLANSSATQLC